MWRWSSVVGGRVAPRVLALAGSWHIVVPHLGAAEPADPAHRRASALAPSSAPGVGTLTYRPPEVCLDDLRFGLGADAQTAARVCVELVQQAPPIRRAATEVDVIM